MTNVVKRLSNLRPTSGLVDYLADGDYQGIPCRIGYINYSDIYDNGGIIPRYLFIDDGITKSGDHYYKATIDLVESGIFVT